MAKYGLYNGMDTTPIQIYEGDSLKREGEFVTVIEWPRNGATVPVKTGTIRLDVNQSVKRMQ